MNELYDMQLHDTLTLMDINCEVVRVPGGWIYHTWHDDTATRNQSKCSTTSVFVPFDNEFQELESVYRHNST